jgi:hypothetical protein
MIAQDLLRKRAGQRMQPHKKFELKEYTGTYQDRGAGWTSYYARFLTGSGPLQVTHVPENQLHLMFKALAQEVRTEAAMGKATLGRIPERTQKQHDMRMVYDALRGIESERFKTLRENGVSEAAMLQQSKEISDGLVARISKTSYAIPQKNYLGLMT